MVTCTGCVLAMLRARTTSIVATSIQFIVPSEVLESSSRACGIADHEITRQFPLDASFVNFFDDPTI